MQLIFSTFAQMPVNWVAVCTLAIVLAMFACSMRFGGSGRASMTDLTLVVALELAAPAVLRSPIDFAHLHGYSLVQWSAALGTAAAILAILIHHRTRLPRKNLPS